MNVRSTAFRRKFETREVEASHSRLNAETMESTLGALEELQYKLPTEVGITNLKETLE